MEPYELKFQQVLQADLPFEWTSGWILKRR